MITKYNKTFKEIYKKIKTERDPLEVIEEYVPVFKEEGLGRLGIFNYLCLYIAERKN